MSSGEEPLAAVLGRKAGRLLRTAKPMARKAVEEGRPRVQAAVNEAIKFASAHEDELRGAATSAIGKRVPGPFRPVVEGLVRGSPKTIASCSECASENPSQARFCNQCGHTLTPS